MKILTGHTNFETAYQIKDYPWGFRLRTTQYVWIETVKKKGDRVIRQTIDPRSGKLCAPKASTFCNLQWLYLDEVGHVQSDGVGIYNKREEVTAAVEKIGIENLLPEQRTQYNSLLGINEKKVDEFTGETKKDFSVKWDKDADGKYDEVKITFDRPDGVSLKEMFKAMQSLNQDKLNQVFEIRESKTWGNHAGTVRICIRGGFMLCTVPENEYKEWLASDANVLEEELKGRIAI